MVQLARCRPIDQTQTPSRRSWVRMGNHRSGQETCAGLDPHTSGRAYAQSRDVPRPQTGGQPHGVAVVMLASDSVRTKVVGSMHPAPAGGFIGCETTLQPRDTAPGSAAANARTATEHRTLGVPARQTNTAAELSGIGDHRCGGSAGGSRQPTTTSTAAMPAEEPIDKLRQTHIERG